ncbi:hypothetical protein BH18ACT12_BH18ACT12_08340 [soil metagenome]
MIEATLVLLDTVLQDADPALNTSWSQRPHFYSGLWHVPELGRAVAVPNAVAEMIERVPPFRPLLSYNFAVA